MVYPKESIEHASSSQLLRLIFELFPRDAKCISFFSRERLLPIHDFSRVYTNFEIHYPGSPQVLVFVLGPANHKSLCPSSVPFILSLLIFRISLKWESKVSNFSDII